MNTEEVTKLLATVRGTPWARPCQSAATVLELCQDLLFCRSRAQKLVERVRELEPEVHRLRAENERLSEQLAHPCHICGEADCGGVHL